MYGKTSGTNIDLASINATDGFKIMSDTTDNLWGQDGTTVIGSWNQLGWSVAAAGDLNGDGFADLIISNPYKDTNPTTGRDSGATYVVYGGQFPSGSPTVFSVAAGDKLGTAGNDTLTGTSGNNQIVAGAGNDTLTGAGGADALYGGAGNDTFVINASNVAAFANTSNSSQSMMKVDGGTGLDTLRLDGAGIALNLKTITHADLASVEHIDITGSGANMLTLSALDVGELGDYNRFNVNPSATDTRKQLMITGSSDDGLSLGSNWLNEWVQPATNNTFTFADNGRTYKVYNSVAGNYQLLIDSAIPLDMTIPTNDGDVQVFGMEGGVEHYQSGVHIAGVGDVNGDGLEDFVIGTRSGGNDTGPSKTYVVFGAAGLNVNGLNLTALETAGNGKGFVINHTLNVIQRPELSVTGNFDYNGDGLMDLVANNGEGKSYVIFGKTNTNSVNLGGSFQSSDGFTITSGGSVSTANAIGDFNGDGHVDTLVSYYTSSWQSYILYGNGTGTNTSFAASGSTNGRYVSTDFTINRDPVTGDFNGDGYADFAISSLTGATTKVNVVFGGPASVTALASNWSLNSVGFDITGIGSNDGYYVTGTKSADINGDGMDDMILEGNESKVWVVLGKTTTTDVDVNNLGTNGFKINYNNTNFVHGHIAADMVGDFNGDGLADMVMSIRDPYGSNNLGSWLVYGRTATTDVNLATMSATDGFKIGMGIRDGNTASTATSDFQTGYGARVAGAGDLNGDGFADLLVSDYTKNSSSGLYNTGTTYVIYGGQFPTGAPTVFSAASGDKLGTAGDDTLTGTSGNNQMLGGQGNDTLSGSGGADVLYGGAGNDTMVLNASNVSAFASASSSQSVMRVDGGTGLDTLRLDGTGITLDLTAITHADLASTEAIDITGSGNNTLRLSLRDVIELGSSNAFNVNPSATDTRVQLMITGDNGDAVQLTDLGGWSSSGTFSYAGETYNVYNNGNAQLLIDQNMVPTS